MRQGFGNYVSLNEFFFFLFFNILKTLSIHFNIVCVYTTYCSFSLGTIKKIETCYLLSSVKLILPLISYFKINLSS